MVLRAILQSFLLFPRGSWALLWGDFWGPGAERLPSIGRIMSVFGVNKPEDLWYQLRVVTVHVLHARSRGSALSLLREPLRSPHLIFVDGDTCDRCAREFPPWAETWSSWEIIVFPSDHFEKKPKVTRKSNIIFPGCGVRWCCSRGVPGGYFWAIVGAPGRNDYHPSERL